MKSEKAKKPFYKRPWFIVLCVLVVLSAIGNIGGKDEPAEPAAISSVSEPAPSVSQPEGSSEPAIVSEAPDVGTESLLSTPDVTSKSAANVSGATTGQRNALEKAKSYLNISAFSYSGLIEQLEYEGFPSEEAAYGVDSCGADWNEQAAKKARSYLNISAFSYSGLIEQLEYEGFTSEEAAYGVDSCGADWNEQAAKKAKSYLNMTAFSRDGLIEQLEYEGFTREQAVYGLEANNYQ